MSIKLLPDLDTQKRIADATEEIASKLGGNKLGEGYISITHAELVTLRNNATLEKGAFYRITDYETTTTQPESRSAGRYFDVIVQALDEKTLSENAQAIHSERDTDGYFNNVKLEAWKLKYTLDNNANEYYWADEVSGKGVIYQMIDEFENDLPYDFKNIQFKRYLIDEYSENTELEGKYFALKDMSETISPSGAAIDSGDFIWAYTFTVIDENGIVNDVSLNKNKTFLSDEGTYYKTEKNTFGFYNHEYYDDVLEQLFIIKALGNNVLLYDYDGEFWGYYSNTIGNGFYSNTIGNGFNSNTIGNYFNSNTIGNDFNSNTIGNGFYSNTIGNGFYSNTIGNGFNSNTIGNYFNSNTIGNDFNSNTIGNYFYYNTIGNYFNYNTIGNDFNSNTIENYIRYIQFSVDGTNSSQIRYLYLKSGLIGASNTNKLDLYFEGLYGRTYPTTFEIIANGNVVSSWEATPLTRTGKVKATKTTATWTDI